VPEICIMLRKIHKHYTQGLPRCTSYEHRQQTADSLDHSKLRRLSSEKKASVCCRHYLIWNKMGLSKPWNSLSQSHSSTSEKREKGTGYVLTPANWSISISHTYKKVYLAVSLHNVYCKQRKDNRKMHIMYKQSLHSTQLHCSFHKLRYYIIVKFINDINWIAPRECKHPPKLTTLTGSNLQWVTKI